MEVMGTIGGGGVVQKKYQAGTTIANVGIPLLGSGAAATDLASVEVPTTSTALTTGMVGLSLSTSGTVAATGVADADIIVSVAVNPDLIIRCKMCNGATEDTALAIQTTTAADATGVTATGVTSGQSVTITENDSIGSKMTVVGSGTLTVALDASSPSYAIGAANTTGNTLSILRFSAANEDIKLTNVPIKLTSATASSSSSDLLQVTLWDGATQIGTAIFAGTNTIATSTMTTDVIVPKDGSKAITIKGDFTTHGTGKPGTPGALVQVDYDNRDTAGARGTGQSSGASATIASGASASSGVRVFRSYPVVEKLSVPTNVLGNGEKSLLRWKVTANSADRLAIGKFSIVMSTTTAKISGLDIYCFTDSSFSSVCNGLSTDGGFLVTNKLGAGSHELGDGSEQWGFFPETGAAASTTIEVPAGATRYFEVRGTVASANSGASVSTQLEGDNAYPDLQVAAGSAGVGQYMYSAATGTVIAHDDFIWSDLNFDLYASSSAQQSNGWFNGFRVPGMSDGLSVSQVQTD